MSLLRLCRIRMAAGALLWLTATLAMSAPYVRINTAASSIGFVSTQMNVPTSGHFGRFAAQVRFDPAALVQDSAQVTIALASTDAGNAEATGMLADKDWFDTAHWPEARFVSSSFRELGGNRYAVAGTLTIKGHSVPVTSVFVATPVVGGIRLDGQLPLSRKAFAIGVGQWADTSVVADRVVVVFHLLVQP